MVVWTKKAQDAVGGRESMNALVDLAILETNLGYESSLVNTRLRLVYKSKISYDESTDFGGHLSRIAGTNDGHMDGIHAIRTAVGADQVQVRARFGLDIVGLK